MPRVLHIEDDPANRLLVRKLLTPAGFEVIDAVDGLDGIQKACAMVPDLVLVDIAIPGLDGYEVTLRLRGEPALANVPIVAITAEGNRDTSLAVGCDGFLQKPIDARSFANTIRSYLKGLKEREPEPELNPLRLQSQRIVSHLEEKLQQLSEANQRLLDLDEARKEFYRNISHELSTPMTPIVGYVKMLRDEELGPLTTPQLKALRAIDECTQRLRGLIDNLLDVTAIESGKLRFIHRKYRVTDLLDYAVGAVKQKLTDSGLRLIKDVQISNPNGVGDPERLGRAIEQLLDNAIKFGEKGRVIALRVSEPDEEQFCIEVADNGKGIDSGLKERVFEPFFQADGSVTRAFGGAGVGLAVARGIAQGHGGTVSIGSAELHQIADEDFSGACFQLSFPRNARTAN